MKRKLLNNLIEWKNDSFYFGEWKNDKRDGTGYLTFASGSYYIGGFKGVNFHGKGLYCLPEKKKAYFSNYKDHKQEGHMFILYEDGSLYYGNAVDDKLTGDVFIIDEEHPIRIEFFGDEVDSISEIEVVTGRKINSLEHAFILPASHYAINSDETQAIYDRIEKDMEDRVAYFEKNGEYECMLVDLIFRKKQNEETKEEIHKLCDEEHCHCEEGQAVWKAALRHTVKEFGFIFAILIEFIGEEKIYIDYGNRYIELGFNATDNYDGDITDKVEIINDTKIYHLKRNCSLFLKNYNESLQKSPFLTFGQRIFY